MEMQAGISLDVVLSKPGKLTKTEFWLSEAANCVIQSLKYAYYHIDTPVEDRDCIQWHPGEKYKSFAYCTRGETKSFTTGFKYIKDNIKRYFFT